MSEPQMSAERLTHGGIVQEATALLDGQAAKCDSEAKDFDATAAQLMVSAKQAADKLIADAQAKANEQTALGDKKRAWAAYWRQLATAERRNAGLPLCAHCERPIAQQGDKLVHTETGNTVCVPDAPSSPWAEHDEPMEAPR